MKRKIINTLFVVLLVAISVLLRKDIFNFNTYMGACSVIVMFILPIVGLWCSVIYFSEREQYTPLKTIFNLLSVLFNLFFVYVAVEQHFVSLGILWEMPMWTWLLFSVPALEAFLRLTLLLKKKKTLPRILTIMIVIAMVILLVWFVLFNIEMFNYCVKYDWNISITD